jgi:hypothetical protein
MPNLFAPAFAPICSRSPTPAVMSSADPTTGAVTFLPKVCDVNITFINRSLEPFVHIVVYFVNVELGVFQNLLNKVFQISGCHALYFLVIQ